MTAVVIITGAAGTAPVTRALARRLTGPVVQIPFDALTRDWPLQPADPALIAETAAAQAKLLTAGYVRAGFHVLLHGSFVTDGSRDDRAPTAIRGLMRTVPGVRALWVGLTPRRPRPAGAPAAPPTDTNLHCDLRDLTPAAAADRIALALASEAHDG